MTLQMGLALAILIGMIVAIVTDKFAFSAPPLMACILLVLTKTTTASVAFSGFIDSNTIMIAGFMVMAACLQKTSLMTKMKTAAGALSQKGGMKAYVLLILLVMLFASVLSGVGGFYVIILAMAANIPYTKELPNSKLILPMGFASARGLIPIGNALFFGFAGSLLKDSGFENDLTLTRFAIMIAFVSAAYLIWCLIAYKILPSHDITSDNDAIEAITATRTKEDTPALPKWKEILVYVFFAISLGGILLGRKLGINDIAFIFPAASSAVMCLIGVISFKDARGIAFSPLIIMTAAVVGVAAALAETGFTPMVGDAIAGVLGGSVSPFVLILLFCLLASLCATLTGASIGSMFVFGPLAISVCMSLGYNPTACAAAVAMAVFTGGFLPVDGLPALALGVGNYKLSDFFKFTIPLYLMQILALSLGAYLVFPMK